MGYAPLTGTIQATKTGLPMPLPNGFMNLIKPTIGDSGRYTRVTGTRRTARMAMYGSPAVRRQLKDIGTVDVKLLHTIEEILINPLVMQQLREYNNYNIQRLGMEEIARQVAEFKQLFVNLRVTAILQVLATGNLYFDAAYNLLPSSSGAKTTVTFQVPANNQNQLNGILPAGGQWNLALTDIPNQLRALKQTARQQTGYPLKYAFYGKNIPSYLTNNDFVLDYLARNPTANNEFVNSGDLPAGLFDFTWIPVYETFYEDINGNFQTIFGNDSVVFTPEVDPSWWEIMEGTYLVPSTLNIITDASAAIASMKQVQGMAGYSYVCANPPTIMMNFLDTFLPVLKVPNAIFQAVVVY